MSVRGRAAALAILLCSTALPALASPHPELPRAAVVARHAAFLTAAAQRELRRRWSAEPERHAELLATAREAFGTATSDAALAAWFAAPPSPGRYEPPARALAQTARWVRAVRGTPLVALPLSPRWKTRAEAACLEHPLGDGVERLALNGHTCRELAADVLDVVTPYESPLQPGHLEALSAGLLARDDGFLDEGLAALSRVPELDRSRDLVAAVRAHLPGWSPLRVLRLLGAATHNHGIELALLERSDDGARLDHLYDLLSAWYGHAHPRPYHFHAAALVACELTTRGYPAWAVALTGDALGETYEAATNGDAGDVQLHREGTRYGIDVCS
ncbi:MAG: hypothetical protein JNK82_13790 [Myxococcaceae bacterium]|nr:hypothetical protein [Myxococcaceae bacterium]